MAAVLEYMSAEILELAGEAARQNHKRIIQPRHVNLAVQLDGELSTLLRDVTISGGGVVNMQNER